VFPLTRAAPPTHSVIANSRGGRCLARVAATPKPTQGDVAGENHSMKTTKKATQLFGLAVVLAVGGL
jgi:hypothetical protein